MDERGLKKRMTDRSLCVLEGTLAERCSALGEALEITFGRGSHADKVTFGRFCACVRRSCEEGTFIANEVLPRIIDFALESTCPEVRNPRAVFISICRKELGWRP